MTKSRLFGWIVGTTRIQSENVSNMYMPKKQTRRMRRKRVRGGRLFGFGAKSQQQINKGLEEMHKIRDDKQNKMDKPMVMHPILENINDDATNDADLPPPPNEKYIVDDGTRNDFIKWLNKINKDFNWSTFPNKTLQEIVEEIDKHGDKSKYLSDFAVNFTQQHLAKNKVSFNQQGGKTRRKRRRRYTKK